MIKRILITGGSGLLGQYLNIEAAGENEILTIFHTHSGNCPGYRNLRLNLSKREQVKSFFSSFKPEIVIHTAAFTNPVLLPNQNPKDIYDINVNATKHIAELCSKHNSKLIYLSTDLVYAGYRGSMLKEDAKLIPVSLYAETKLMGEIKIKQTFEKYLILRTALLYGFGLNHSRCHFHNMYENLQKTKSVNLFTDQYRTPISLHEAAKIIMLLCKNDLHSETINIGGIERVSRYQLGEILCDTAGFDKSLLIKSTLDDLPELPKVEDVSLNTEKLQSLGLKAKSIEENILKIIHNHSGNRRVDSSSN
jgi:dTDP-4-dehydrorhamnose reductase